MWIFLRWIIFLGIFAGVGYSLSVAAWSYYTTDELVERALRESLARNQSALTSGRGLGTVADDVQSSILREAQRNGLSVEKGDVDVSANPALVSATVRWSQRLITYGGRDILVVPLSVHRSVVPLP